MEIQSRSMPPRIWIAAVTGSAIEWFDYFLYGTLASLVFNRLFFPTSNPVLSLTLTYMSFALTFFVRPLGGMLFSGIGDRLGRKKTLVMTLTLMGGATVAIGLLPTYARIGIAAPILLVLLRLVQGLGIGGEWGGALLLAYEYAPPERRGFFASLPQTGTSLGVLLANLCVSIASLLPDPAFLSWGWRLPFLASAALVAVGLWIRKDIDETPDFKAMKARHAEARSPLRRTLTHNWRAVLVAIAAKMVETGPFYIFTVFVVGYVTGPLGLSRTTALNAVTIAALLSLVSIPLVGMLSDRLGRRWTFLLGCAVMMLFAAPYFMIRSFKTFWAVAGATILGIAIVWPILSATLGTLMADLFTTEVRYTGITLGYQIGAALAGGTAPLIGTWLLARNHGDWTSLAAYIMLTALISATAVLAGGRPRGSA
jgi:metabolite-proton symporter